MNIYFLVSVFERFENLWGVCDLKMKKLRLLTIMIYCCLGLSVFAYTLDYYNFIDQNNYIPSLVQSKYELVFAGYTPLKSDTIVKSTGSGTELDAAVIEPKVTEKPLIYPNPLRCKDNPKLGYGLSKDMRANEVFKKLYDNGVQGSRQGYNLVDLTEFVVSFDLPSGVYIFVLINNNKVLGKGKFVVMP